MKQIDVAKFKKRCLTLLDKLAPDGLTITKHGRPVAKVTPYRSEVTRLIGSLSGKIEIRGPIKSTGAWESR